MQKTIEEPNTLNLDLVPIYNLIGLRQYVSSTVLDNLKQALDGYCPTLLSEGKIESCEAPPPDPPLPKPRVWSHWSNDNDGYSGHGKEYPVEECPEGEFLSGMQWKEQDHYGILDVKIACSGNNEWREPIVGRYDHNHHGEWNKPMICGDKGFRQITGREQSHLSYGIVNVQAFCLNTETEMTSNDNMGGEYNKDLYCRNGGQVVGIQVMKQTNHGIINFKVLCA